MGLGQVAPGRYSAMVKDWGLNEVERLDGALEAWVSFNFIDQANEEQEIVWKSLVMTRAGDRNKKTTMTLETCGLVDGDMIKFMEPDALDMKTPLDITIVDQPSKDGTKVYKQVEWVNRSGEMPAGGAPKKVTGDAKQSMEQKLIAMGLGKPRATNKPTVRNHAPGAEDEMSAAGKELGF